MGGSKVESNRLAQLALNRILCHQSKAVVEVGFQFVKRLAVRVTGLGKRYRIGMLAQRNDTLRDQIVDFSRRTAARTRAGLVEFDLRARPVDMAEAVLARVLRSAGIEPEYAVVRDAESLLPLGAEPVSEVGEVDLPAARDVGGAFQRVKLVLHERLRVVQEPADEGRFSIVDAAAGHEAQQLFPLQILQIPGKA